MGARSLTLEERYQLFALRLAAWPVCQIAEALGRGKSCLYDELKRCGNAHEYCPERAQQHRELAAQRSASNHPTKPAIAVRQVKRRLQGEWSPEQISGRRALIGEVRFSTSGIYQRALREGWAPLLRRFKAPGPLGRPASRPYHGSALPIRQRAKEVLDRIDPGHWEADTMLGKRNDCKRVLVVVERQSEFTICRLLHPVSAKQTAKWLKKELAHGKLPFETITTDRGGEFMTLGDCFPGQAYVCDPHRPNQRGTNENTIGLLRQYFPKGKTTAHLTQRNIKRAQDKLNHRPRKSLGYLTPYEVMFNRPPTVRS